MNRPLRILIVTNLGASANAVRPEAEIVLNLARAGHHVYLISPPAPHFKVQLDEAGVIHLVRPPWGRYHLGIVRLIRHTIRQYELDIVQAFNKNSLTNSAMACAGLSVVLVAYRGYTGNIHWFDPTCYLSTLHPRINLTVCLAESVRQLMLANGVKAARLVTINKGHRASWYHHVLALPRAEFGATNHDLLVAFVANNRLKMKGVFTLIDALALLPRSSTIKVVCLGNNLDAAPVLAALKRKEVQHRMLFLGHRSDSLAVVKACDAAVSASAYGEATQKAVIEALFLAVPVVITDVDGNHGMVANGEGGWVVPVGDSAAMAKALETIESRSPAERRAMGEAARARAIKLFDADKTAAQYEAAYRRLVER